MSAAASVASAAPAPPAPPALPAATAALFDALVHGQGSVQRRALAKAITLLESTRAEHRVQADALLGALLPHTGRAFRLALSGAPGVGKSTFIEALGLHLTGQGLRVAVLTIDPSSRISGGAILGDKTRMQQLAVQPGAFIRPSPSGATPGGVAEMTREAMLACEAAGYALVVVETVGAGQNEVAAAAMTDMFVLMQLPHAGDELQAIKKGVMEIADLVLISKADTDPHAATRAQAQIAACLRILGQNGRPARVLHEAREWPQWQPTVLQLSSLQGQGVAAFWAAVTQFRELQTANGRLAARRRQQALAWMWERVDAGLKRTFLRHPQVSQLLPGLQAEVAAGRIAPSIAARNLLDAQVR